MHHPLVMAALLGAALAQNQAQNQDQNQGDAQACARQCTDAFNGCRSQPGANQATCQTTYASCLGYNPGTGVTATACANNHGDGGQGGNAWASSQPSTSTPTTVAGGVGGVGGVGQEDCVARCNAAKDSCRTQPNANQSYCSSQYASCLGYNPYQNGAFVTPTACSGSASGVAPTGTVPVVAGGEQLSPAYAAMAVGLLALL
ncbi:hypothetical protein C2857_000519 [Epichloe festucae Fl1]|uniref:Uncharacterized protein n=1 Tax=Epichloe festucae (strain Fl1) TaxID=877507 RepID=A0A7S9KJQ9_EPIFF|nr:hypothetical protein C2857_000519 [Epichloe festucae Fl1]